MSTLDPAGNSNRETPASPQGGCALLILVFITVLTILVRWV